MVIVFCPRANILLGGGPKIIILLLRSTVQLSHERRVCNIFPVYRCSSDSGSAAVSSYRRAGVYRGWRATRRCSDAPYRRKRLR